MKTPRRAEPRFRAACGTAEGAAAHHARGEVLCGWCRREEQVARVTAELPPSAPRSGTYAPVTAAQARLNAALLDAEVLAYENDHPPGPGERAA